VPSPRPELSSLAGGAHGPGSGSGSGPGLCDRGVLPPLLASEYLSLVDTFALSLLHSGARAEVARVLRVLGRAVCVRCHAGLAIAASQLGWSEAFAYWTLRLTAPRCDGVYRACDRSGAGVYLRFHALQESVLFLQQRSFLASNANANAPPPGSRHGEGSAAAAAGSGSEPYPAYGTGDDSDPTEPTTGLYLAEGLQDVNAHVPACLLTYGRSSDDALWREHLLAEMGSAGVEAVDVLTCQRVSERELRLEGARGEADHCIATLRFSYQHPATQLCGCGCRGNGFSLSLQLDPAPGREYHFVATSALTSSYELPRPAARAGGGGGGADPGSPRVGGHRRAASSPSGKGSDGVRELSSLALRLAPVRHRCFDSPPREPLAALDPSARAELKRRLRAARAAGVDWAALFRDCDRSGGGGGGGVSGSEFRRALRQHCELAEGSESDATLEKLCHAVGYVDASARIDPADFVRWLEASDGDGDGDGLPDPPPPPSPGSPLLKSMPDPDLDHGQPASQFLALARRLQAELFQPAAVTTPPTLSAPTSLIADPAKAPRSSSTIPGRAQSNSSVPAPASRGSAASGEGARGAGLTAAGFPAR
jgi:hypothetical protein